VYDYSAMNIYENETVSMSRYQGNVMAIMNVATYWGLTTSHYLGMNAHMEKFSSAGFRALGFPCNNFYMLEPGANASEILGGLTWVRPGNGYVPNFDMYKKVDVNGKNELKLYTYLKSMCGPTSDQFEDGLYYDPIAVSDVRWNYEIFLVNKMGLPVYRYSPDHDTLSIAPDIQNLVNMPIEASIREAEVKEAVEEVEELEREVEQPPVSQEEMEEKNNSIE